MLCRLAARAVALVAALWLAGCGAKEAAPEVKLPSPNDLENPTFGIPIAKPGTSTVSGKVTLNGEPVVTGRVLLFTAEGMLMAPGVIDGSGAYRLEGVPDGPAEAVVLLDPNGEMPYPTGGGGGAGAPPGAPPGGGPPGIPGGGPPGMPPGPPGGAPRPPDFPGAPPGGPPAGLHPGAQPLPPPFLEMMKFTAAPKDQAKYAAAHKKYGKTSLKNPLKLTVAGATTYDIVLKD